METEPEILIQSIRLLELFASQIDQPFDRQKARKILLESHRNEATKPHEDWLDTVASCAESLEVRIRRVETTFDDILPMVQNGFPVAHLAGIEPKSQVWWVIIRVKGQRVQVADMRQGKSRWVSRSELNRLLGISPAATAASWLVCYPVLMGDSNTNFMTHPASGGQSTDHHTGHHGGHHGHGPPPLRRIMQILRPERSDITTILIFAFVVGLLALTTPIATEALVNTVAFGQFIQPVIILSLIVLVFLSFSSAITVLQIYVMEILQRRMFVRLVDDLAYRLPRVCQEAVDQHRLSELTNRFLDITTIQKSLANLLLDGSSLIIQGLVGMVVLAFYHPFLLGFDILLLLLIAFTLFTLGRGGVSTAINESFQKYETLAWLQELGRCTTSFKLNDGLEFAVERADHLAVDYIRARKAHFAIYVRQIVFSLAIYSLAMTALLGLGGWLVIAEDLSLGQLIAAELIVLLILRSFTKLGIQLKSFYDLMAATDKVGVLLDLPIEEHDKLLDLPADQPVSLQFENVSFKIAGQTVLRALNFKLAAGESLVIVGDGTTGIHYLGDLCLGLRSASTGVIKIDEVEMREFRLDSLRSLIGVAREGEIFEGTLEENIHLHRPSVSMLDVRRIANDLGLMNFVNGLPDGLSTQLSASGFPLTPSQAKRVSLARACANHPRLLVLDRILDSFSQSEAHEIIKYLASDCNASLLVISSRPDFINLCQLHVNLGGEGGLGCVGN